jgi:hypothetical protein
MRDNSTYDAKQQHLGAFDKFLRTPHYYTFIRLATTSPVGTVCACLLQVLSQIKDLLRD